MSIYDSVTRHQVFVQRYAAGREREAVAFIDKLIKTVNKRLASDVTEFSRARLESILFDLKAYSNEALSTYSKLTIKEALKFAEYETGFNERLLDSSISVTFNVPSAAQVSKAMFSSIMQVEPSRSYTIENAMRMFNAKKSEQIVNTIRSGVILGDTREQITTSLMQIKDLQRQQAATLTRTITNHISAETRNVFITENEELLDGYEWVAVLDSRTSLICGSRDGKIYPISDNRETSPKPPAHFSCRSTIVPAVKPEYDLGAAAGAVGQRASVGADGVKLEKGNLTYEQWLSKQPKAFQVEVLGKNRAELFRKGNLKLSSFVDSAGATINLDRLKELEPLAFQKADI